MALRDLSMESTEPVRHWRIVRHEDSARCTFCGGASVATVQWPEDVRLYQLERPAIATGSSSSARCR
jgi:hypothetical protein